MCIRDSASGGNLLVRGDLMEKYGYEDITSREELEAFLDDVYTGCLLYTSIVPEGNDFNKPGEHRNLTHCVGNGSRGVR